MVAPWCWFPRSDDASPNPGASPNRSTAGKDSRAILAPLRLMAQALVDMRTLIAGIGAAHADDRSFGATLRETLAHDAPITAAHVVVEELSSDLYEAVRRLNDEWPRFDRMIVVAAVARDRPPGTIAAYRWDGEADDGTASDESLEFDSTLLTLRELADIPDELIVVEVEPGSGDAGQDSPLVERARTLVRRLATNGTAAAHLPRSALGGPSNGLRE